MSNNDSKQKSKPEYVKAQTKKWHEARAFVSLQDATLLTGLSPPTLRKLGDQSKIITYRTPSGQRLFSRESILSFTNVDLDSKPTRNGRTNFLYARVSSKHQTDDLQRQIDFLKANTDGDNYELVQDVGSGINFKRAGLKRILDACSRRAIGKVVVSHKDRLCRFAFELIKSFIDLSGGKLIILDNSDCAKSCEQELAEDLLSIIHVFSCRQMGRRRYSKRKTEEKNVTT